jgi:hypothetical protein
MKFFLQNIIYNAILWEKFIRVPKNYKPTNQKRHIGKNPKYENPTKKIMAFF